VTAGALEHRPAVLWALGAIGARYSGAQYDTAPVRIRIKYAVLIREIPIRRPAVSFRIRIGTYLPTRLRMRSPAWHRALPRESRFRPFPAREALQASPDVSWGSVAMALPGMNVPESASFFRLSLGTY